MRSMVLRRLLTIFALLFVALGVSVGSSSVARANGCGVPFDGVTYSLSLPVHFTLLGTCDPTANYVLLNDVNLTGITVSRRDSFTGSFDGGGFTISNMTVTSSALFSVGALGATFTRVNFQNATVIGGGGLSNWGGALVKENAGTTTITNSSFQGTVTAGSGTHSRTGGLVGAAFEPVIINNVAVVASVIGGVTQSAVAGGLIGFAADDVNISDSSFTGSVTGGSGNAAAAGGFIGSILSNGGPRTLSIASSYSSATVFGGTGLYASAGGFVGYNFDGSLVFSSTYMKGTVTGGVGNAAAAGGFVGLSENPLTISRSYMTGALSGGSGISASAGGFVGTWRLVSSTQPTQVTNSFVRATGTGGLGGASRTGGIVGDRQTNIELTTTITNSYGEGTLTSGVGLEAWAFALSSTAAPTISATASFCVTSCESGGTGLGATVSATNLVATATAAGWDFSTIWCVSASYNDGFPVLKGLTFGPNAAWGSCGAPIASPAIVPVWKISADLDGGSCGERSGALSGYFVGYRYLPGADECSRPGYVFRGWARATDPITVVDLPVLVDPLDGVRRYFLASGGDLVAVWSAAPKPPAPVTTFFVFGNFLCGRCTSLWLIWSSVDERQTTTSRAIVSDSHGNQVCTSNVVDIAPWRLCLLSGLTPGSSLAYSIVISDGGATSSPVTAQITLRNRP